MPPRYQITRTQDLDPVECPCGTARRAFANDPDGVASLHVVEVAHDSRTHYRKRMTELYHVLTGEGTIELDGESFPIGPGSSVLIKPGCRHRAVPNSGAETPLRLLNVPVPAFDPEDEWFD